MKNDLTEIDSSCNNIVVFRIRAMIFMDAFFGDGYTRNGSKDQKRILIRDSNKADIAILPPYS
ncbi:hypothetical protein TorRG33x02_139010 [Trema orientale]|uniref:Uncharacterized protein n=1 Tax=Trema orientale TaxID=63057 RepID=A0A2P5EXI7_TREOI|nr:hypothetical protein TorRG33x02_139010 [Trema orientale]